MKPLFNRTFRIEKRNFIKKCKKCLQHRCFPVELAKLLRTPTFEENLRTTASETCSNFTRNALSRLLTLLTQIDTYALVFVLQLSYHSIITKLSFANSPFTTIDNAIIRSSRPVVFCKKRCSYRFIKIDKKTLALKTRF